MSNIIMAMGADHTKPEKLVEIVRSVRNAWEVNMNDGYVVNVNRAKTMELLDSIAPADHRIILDQLPKFTYGMDIYNRLPYVTEEKFDGYSYLFNGEFYSKRLSDASGSKGQPIYKTQHLPHISSHLGSICRELGMDLHGEIYSMGGISDDVTKVMGCTAEEAVKRQFGGICKPLHYMLIDIRKIYDIDITKQPYRIRRAILEAMYYRYIENSVLQSFVHLAPTSVDPVSSFRDIVSNGGEGIIIKKCDALYVPGKKPAGVWIKGKRKITIDVVITGYLDGTGKNQSMFGSIKYGLYENGKLVEKGAASSGLDDDTRAIIASNPDKYIGTVMEIESIQQSKNSFRNAVFLRLRDDKSASECTVEGIRTVLDLI